MHPVISGSGSRCAALRERASGIGSVLRRLRPYVSTPHWAGDERKHVSILFADVVGSMKLAAALDAERLREIMHDLFNRSAAVVQRYNGTVDKFTGDGLMALFGAPTALEDHAIACMHCRTGNPSGVWSICRRGRTSTRRHGSVPADRHQLWRGDRW